MNFTRLSLQRQLGLMLLTIMVGFAIYGIWSWRTLDKLRIQGDTYQQIVEGKDLIADILPPPLFIIESYLTALQISQVEQATELTPLIAHLVQLEKDYGARRDFWQLQSLPATLANGLLDSAHAPAAEFFRIVHTQFLPAVSAHDAASVNASLVGLAQAFQQHRSAIDRVVTDANAFNAQTEASASALLSFSRYALIAVFVLSIVISVMVYQAISGRLARDVQALTRHISRFAEGNLSVPVTLDRGDELGAMAQGIEHTRAALASLVGSLRQQSNQIVASSSVLSGAALAIDVGAQEQADSANSMAAAVEELGASITEIGNSARRVRDLSQGVGARSLESDKAIEQMVAQVHEVSSRVRASAGDVKVLSETGESILRIVTVISEIADQTNLLALNAAIEAARAGDQGRGFAVVADEVRQLASRTAASTQEINAMIGAMHAATGKAVESITKGSEYAQLTVSSAESAKNALQETVGDIETLVTDIAQISGALLEQRSASEQIGSNVESTARATEKHGFAIKDIAATSTSLDEMAKQLAQSVARFST